MNIYIVIPAHNEQASIGLTLDSLANQTLIPKKVVVVNDNSTDNTRDIVESYIIKYSWISLVNFNSSNEHLPGTKIINAFYQGFDTLDDEYDVICKYDADLIFPENYLETLINHFNSDSKLGMVAGLCYIQKNNNWILEDLTAIKHVRGALKAYRKVCFLNIGKLKRSMGWDTIDELLAQYYGWSFKTDESLKVKHLKPTGISYGKNSKHMQGEALYKLRYGFSLAFIASLKLAYKKNSFTLFKEYISGYLRASREKVDFLITPDQGRYIRKHLWKNIVKKFF
ncbi:MAG: glycosyltransferase family 2 protein [Bacteroidetes bacterium]|nr:MAG: glycosyltransferase family 2 protein [Bacteroidota bacterium]